MGKQIGQKLQLVIIICAVVTITAMASHILIAWLKIGTGFGVHWVIGPATGNPSVYVAGSSLAGDGLSWASISAAVNMKIEGWIIPGSSPAEWVSFKKKAAQTKLTVLVVSPYDLNEHFLCDFRAEVVPLKETITDLWRSRAEWSFCKRVLSQYPLTYFRRLFPTAARSDGVMVGIREKLKKLLTAVFPIESEAGPILSFNESGAAQEYRKQKISNWSAGRMLRRLAAMRGDFQGRHAFDGPKNIAFLRMLDKAQEQGATAVIVLPVSPAYTNEFLTPEVKREFEKALNEAQSRAPEAHWIRLDQIKELNSDEYFWDLVHMNAYGQKIATEAFLSQIKRVVNQL